MIETLERSAIHLPAENDLRASLGKKAEALLGYSVLRKDAKVPGELAKALAKLGIEPFSKESVQKYKEQKLAEWHEANPQASSFMRNGFLDTNIVSELRRLENMRKSMWGNGDPRGLTAALDREIDRLRAVADRDMLRDEREGSWRGISRMSFKAASWSETPLRGYDNPVPEFVISKAVEIKEECPGAEFFVDELKEETRTIDPFLVVKLKEEFFYVEVWEEPEFEKTL